MRIKAFSVRCLKEILRDPLSLVFGIAFPLVLLFLMSAIQANIPVAMFQIERLAPGIAVFGLSFITLFSGSLIAKDRTSSFLTRLFASPMKSGEYIAGYTMPLLPAALTQSVICFAAAMLVGLKFSARILLCIAALIPSALLFIAFGLLFGCIMSDKAVGGISSILVNAAAWLSGIWFDLELVGGVFKKIAYCLPFVHCVDAAKLALSGSCAGIGVHLAWILGYSAVIFAAAVLCFSRKMKSL